MTKREVAKLLHEHNKFVKNMLNYFKERHFHSVGYDKKVKEHVEKNIQSIIELVPNEEIDE